MGSSGQVQGHRSLENLYPDPIRALLVVDFTRPFFLGCLNRLHRCCCCHDAEKRRILIPYVTNHEPRGGFYMWIPNKRNAWGKVAHLCIPFFFSSPGVFNLPLVDELEVNSFVAKVWRIPLAKGGDYMA